MTTVRAGTTRTRSVNGTPMITSSGVIPCRWWPPMKSKSPPSSRSRAASTVAGGYGSRSPIAWLRPIIVTFSPAARRASATEIASNVPVSSYTTAGSSSLARPPKPKTSHDVNTCGRSWPGTGSTGVASWKPSRARATTRGHDHLVRRQLLDDVRVDHRAQPDRHPEPLDLRRQPLRDGADVASGGAPWRRSSPDRRAAGWPRGGAPRGPRSAAVRAASNPAGPPPTTSTRLRLGRRTRWLEGDRPSPGRRPR